MELSRYHRQMLLPGWGRDGQERLAAASALVVGCGALGCAIADALARAGVGRLTIVDRDVVELTNLQRQMLFDERDVAEGLPKAEAAARRLRGVNSAIAVNAVVVDVAPRNAEALARGHSVILDGTDNFETRYLMNDVAVKRGVPYIYGGAVATRGMEMAIVPGTTPCLRCIFEDPPAAGTSQTCDTAGVLGPVVSVIAACQAADAIRVILGEAAPARLLDVDLWSGNWRTVDVSRAKRLDCPCCGQGSFQFLEGKRSGETAVLCGQNAVQVAPSATELDLRLLAGKLAAHGSFQLLPSMLVRGYLTAERGENGDPISLTVFADGRAIVKGTAKPERARSLYARYIGA